MLSQFVMSDRAKMIREVCQLVDGRLFFLRWDILSPALTSEGLMMMILMTIVMETETETEKKTRTGMTEMLDG